MYTQHFSNFSQKFVNICCFLGLFLFYQIIVALSDAINTSLHLNPEHYIYSRSVNFTRMSSILLLIRILLVMLESMHCFFCHLVLLCLFQISSILVKFYPYCWSCCFILVKISSNLVVMQQILNCYTTSFVTKHSFSCSRLAHFQWLEC